MERVEIQEHSLQLAQLPVFSIGRSEIGRILEGRLLATEDGLLIATEDGEPLIY